MRVLSPATLEFELRTRVHTWIFLASLALASLPLIYIGGKAAATDTLANSQNTLWLERAIRLDPSHPALHYRLGVLQLFSLEKPDSFTAFDHLHKAAELSPNSGPYWLALATAAESVGNTRAAQDAIQHALKCRPMSPDYWWRAANFYLRAGQNESAWDHCRRVLELSPGHAELVFRLCQRAAGDFHVVSDKVLPLDASPTLRLAYVDFLSRHGDYEGAFRAWRQLGSNLPRTKVTFSSAQSYIDALIAGSRLNEAMTVWHDLLKLQVITRPASANPEDAVFNGGFEQVPLNAGFDWRVTQKPFVVADLQASPAFRGTKAARVDFTVKHNEEYEILYQFALVEPRREYRLEAFVRSEGITSDSGPRLRIVDAESPARLDVATPPVLGTTGQADILRRA
jgi:tetratricopeptide (TPR) repeat protein